MIGTKFAHYEITSHLGSGGMGDVYQATDLKLGRSVAIKFLPETFRHDSERIARFEREARVLASLNHPHIAGIYGVEESGERKFLVMELVGGETLAERIKRGPIAVEESLEIAKQICEALESAHEKGIVHRDLKPANVKITPDGIVKVLDFGLAKAFEAETSKANLSQSPTLIMGATNAGVILGTAAYMSPEQAKGRTVDKRTDIFAFGCVLYEMLTGRPAFGGEDIPEILSMVLQRDPDWELLPPKVTPRIRELLRLCLEKDLKTRRRDAGDVRIDIERTINTPHEISAAVTASRIRERLAWGVAAVSLIGMAALAVPAARYLRETSPPEMRVEISMPTNSDPLSFALSPDGRQLAFVTSADGRPRLWVRALDKMGAQPLVGTDGARYPFWSPDSRSIGFFDGQKLKRIDLAGGLAQAITNAVGRGGTWNADGVILFAPIGPGPLFRITASGGEAVAVTKLDKQVSHRFPQFLPGGRQFLFYAQGTPETAGIWLGSLDAPQTKRLTPADAAGVYAPGGWLLFIRAGTLMAQRLDLDRQQLTGDPVTVADPVAFDPNNSVAVSVSATGLLAYRAGGTNRRQLTWFDRSGKVLGAVGSPDENTLASPRLSPDGRRVAVSRSLQGNQDIWFLDGTRTTHFTFDASSDTFPLWSPDGSRIVFTSDRKGLGHGDLYQKPASGAGSEQLLWESAEVKRTADWSADGRFILYNNLLDAAIWILPLEGDRKPFVFLKTSFRIQGGQFSPDGRWIAYMSNESGRYEIYVRPFPRAGGQWQVSTAGGINPRWGSGGKELDYIAPDGILMAAPIAIEDAAIEPGRPVALFHTRIFGGGTDVAVGPQYDVSRDGRFLINTVLEDVASPITLIQNWSPEPKK
jgi:eukaryotic-like serine/threonine-protein kinase